MKSEREVAVGESLKIPTEEARKALRLLWYSVTDDHFELKDFLLIVVLVLGVINIVVSFL